MAGSLEGYKNKMVHVVTGDGRSFVGTLKGFDQTINIILQDSHERVFSMQEGVQRVPMGLYIIRGDNVVLVGELDDELDRQIDLDNTRAEPLNHVVH